MGCCQSDGREGSELKRHPLLRDANDDSRHSNSQLEASVIVSQLKYRAKLDAIRGPPALIVSKMPGNLGAKPEVIRGAIKNGIHIHNLEVPKEFHQFAWFNLHFTDFHSHLQLFQKYVLPKDCTPITCPLMRDKPENQYIWIYDDDGNPQSTINKKLTAPSYLEKCIEIVGKILIKLINAEEGGDESFQSESTMIYYKNMTRLIFQFYTHILYWHHDAFARISAVTHLNFCFRWFILFVHLYRLLNDNEAEPLKYVIQQSLDIDDGRPSESLSAYPESSSYRSSDDLSKVTMPSFDYRSERMISNPSTLHS